MIRGNARSMSPALERERRRMGRIGAALCQCEGRCSMPAGIGAIGGGPSVPMPTSIDPATYGAQLSAAASAKLSSMSSTVQAQIKAQTTPAATAQREAAGVAAAASLATNGFNPNDPADEQKLIAAISGGLCLIPAVGPVLGLALETLYQVGNAIACPTEQFFSSIGLSTLPPACGGAPCKTSGNWSGPGILAFNKGQSVPASLPNGSFAQFAFAGLATYAAMAANCKGGIPATVLMQAMISVWNQAHAGPSVKYFIPPISILGTGPFAVTGAVVTPQIVTAWQHTSGSIGDPNVYYAFRPISDLKNASNASHPELWSTFPPYPIAPDLPGYSHIPPTWAPINTGAPIPPPHKTIMLKLGPPPAPPHKTIMLKLGPPPAKPSGMSTGAKVATYAAAGGGAYALGWWLWRNGWKWVTPDPGDVVKWFKRKG